MALKPINTLSSCRYKVTLQQNLRWNNGIISVIVLGLFINKITNFGNENGQGWPIYFFLCLLLIPFFIVRIQYEIQISNFLEDIKGTLDNLLNLNADLYNNIILIFPRVLDIFLTYIILCCIFSKQLENNNHTKYIIFALLCLFYINDVQQIVSKIRYKLQKI
jgi:hypothetical protein